jgi:hypothetical protein
MIIKILNATSHARIVLFRYSLAKTGSSGDSKKDTQLFPYQELRKSVPVWQTTCKKYGQEPDSLSGNGNDGSKPWSRHWGFSLRELVTRNETVPTKSSSEAGEGSRCPFALPRR